MVFVTFFGTRSSGLFPSRIRTLVRLLIFWDGILSKGLEFLSVLNVDKNEGRVRKEETSVGSIVIKVNKSLPVLENLDLLTFMESLVFPSTRVKVLFL